MFIIIRNLIRLRNQRRNVLNKGSIISFFVFAFMLLVAFVLVLLMLVNFLVLFILLMVLFVVLLVVTLMG